MDFRKISNRTENPNMEEFKNACQPLIKWMNKNCNPHEIIVIKMGSAILMSDEMGFSFEIPD